MGTVLQEGERQPTQHRPCGYKPASGRVCTSGPASLGPPQGHPTLGVWPSWGEGWAVSAQAVLDVPSHSHQPGPVGLEVTVVRVLAQPPSSAV